MSVAGQELLVHLSRAKDLKYLAIGNCLDTLVIEKLSNIGKIKNGKRKEFLKF